MVHFYRIHKPEPVHPWRSMLELTSTGDIMTLSEAQYHLGIDPQAALSGGVHQTAEDAEVQRKIAEVRRWAEDEVHRTFRTSVEREMTLDDFSRVIWLWQPPLISVESVEYLDDAATYQAIDVAEYRVLTPTDGRGCIHFDVDFSAPSHKTAPDAIKVTYTSGYAEMPPNAVAAAKLMLTALWDDNLDSNVIENNMERANNLLHTLEWGSYE